MTPSVFVLPADQWTINAVFVETVYPPTSTPMRSILGSGIDAISMVWITPKEIPQ
jgi:hypothetical protein